MPTWIHQTESSCGANRVVNKPLKEVFVGFKVTLAVTYKNKLLRLLTTFT